MIAVTAFDASKAACHEWEELADRTAASPFVRPGWIAAWWRAFGKGELELITARRDGRLSALLPLVREGTTTSSPTNWHTPEFAIVADSVEAAREIALAALARRPRRLAISFVNGNGPDVATWLDAARETGGRVVMQTLECSPYLDVIGTWEAFEKTLGRHRVSELRRRRRRLEERGRVEFDVVDGGPDLAAALEDGLAIEGSGWKTEQGTAILSRPDTASFYRDVGAWSAERGWLRLLFLRLDGRPIAFQYVIEANGVAYFLKGGYDVGYARYSPGSLLARDVLAWAFRSGMRTYEFLGTDEGFKREWTSRTRERLRIQAFAPTTAGVAEWAAWAYGRPAAKRVLAAAGRR